MNTGIEKLDRRSRERLNDARVHPSLRAVAEHAANARTKWVITEVMRTLERQKVLKAAGASRTLNSKHLIGRAFDAAVWVDGEVRWDWPLYDMLSAEIKLSARALQIPIVWGGDWEMKDGPHFELDDSVQ